MLSNKNNYKIIRDPIHGDIKLPNKFVKLIDTCEFQRLHRIKQLSVANSIFPSAVHTRFSHSIGVFHIMSKLLGHFEELFNNLGLKISKDQKDLALCAALLHDIGHGPYSHTFELAFGSIIKKSHEDWTIEIIRSKESEVNKVLRSSFGRDFPEKICDLISYNFDSEEADINIFKIIALLVSSQLDADRMDYLLRDAFFTGTTHSKFDLNRLIKSLSIDLLNDEYCICTDKNSITIIEEYLLSRYFMYKEVYLNPMKQQMEYTMKKIFLRVIELHSMGEDVFIPCFLKQILCSKSIDLKEYLDLDDSSIVHYIKEWKKSTDYTLKTLCECILNRNKFKKFHFEEKRNLEQFKNDFENILNSQCGNNAIDLNNSYFWIEYSEKVELYKQAKEKLKNIFVRRENGTLEYLPKEAYIINNYNISDNSRYFVFINESIFNAQYKNLDLNNIISLQLNNHTNNNLKIEKKYLLKDYDQHKNIEQFLCSQKEYKVYEKNECFQRDLYFDDSSFTLFNNNRLLRIRHNIDSDTYILSIKVPLKEGNSKDNQRFEFEYMVDSFKINNYMDIVKSHIVDALNVSFEDISNVIVIETHRKEYVLTKKEVSISLRLDTSTYKTIDGTVLNTDYELELELLSHYSHRIILNQLGNTCVKEFKVVESNNCKYTRGIHTVRLI